ncbi:MAG: FadR/GntR family transcriptional regulator, partial [Roseiflexaceae bacterium]
MKQPPIEVRATPLSERVAHDVLRRILAGEFAPEGMLPSERLLQATYNVSRPVVREAIKILSARGIATPV